MPPEVGSAARKEGKQPVGDVDVLVLARDRTLVDCIAGPTAGRQA